MSSKSIFDAWNRCRAWLVPALLPDETEDEVLNALLLNRAQLWEGDRAAMVTELVSNTDNFLHVYIGGGDLQELLSMIPGVAAWGRMMNCDWASIHGRRGWARVLAPFGFAPHGNELWKALR